MHKLDKALVQELLGLLNSTWPDARFNVRYDTVTMGKPMATAECATLTLAHIDDNTLEDGSSIVIRVTAAQVVQTEDSVMSENYTVAVVPTPSLWAAVSLSDKPDGCADVRAPSAALLVAEIQAAVRKLVAARHARLDDELREVLCGVYP